MCGGEGEGKMGKGHGGFLTVDLVESQGLEVWLFAKERTVAWGAVAQVLGCFLRLSLLARL